MTTVKDALQPALAEIIQKAITTVESGVSFLSAEIPSIVHQLLLWKAIESFIYFCMFGIIVGVSIYLMVVKCGKGAKERGEYKETWTHDKKGLFTNPLPYIIFGVLILVLSPSFATETTWIKILVSPKVYLIEYAAQLIK